jgi:benzil reductase ((S)-benzoin forming)
MDLFVITGATRGLGAALHEEVMRNIPDTNDAVISLSRTSALASRSASAPSPAPALDVLVDFAKPASLERALPPAEHFISARQWDRAVLINNAAVVAPVGEFDTATADALTEHLNVNVASPMLLTGWFARATRGHVQQRLVVNISSGAAKRPVPGWFAYCTGKAALEMATQVAAQESALRDPTLAVCSLAPGVVDTPMQAQIRGMTADAFPDVERFRSMKQDGQLKDAHDVARQIIALIRANRLTNGGSFDLRTMDTMAPAS